MALKEYDWCGGGEGGFRAPVIDSWLFFFTSGTNEWDWEYPCVISVVHYIRDVGR